MTKRIEQQDLEKIAAGIDLDVNIDEMDWQRTRTPGAKKDRALAGS